MKFLIKFFFILILVSCSSNDIKVSKYARINDFNQYENNYASIDIDAFSSYAHKLNNNSSGFTKYICLANNRSTIKWDTYYKLFSKWF